MSVADWIQLAIAVSTGIAAVFTAFAAIAAWRAANTSKKSVQEQKLAGQAAASEAAKQITALDEQIRALQTQANAADEHSRTARQQAEAEAIRWSAQAHLDLKIQRGHGGYKAVIEIRGSIAAAEFALFRRGLLPRDFFFASILRHIEDTVFQEPWSTPQRQSGTPIGAFPRGTSVTSTPGEAGGGDLAVFTRLWDAITKAVNGAQPQTTGCQLTDNGKAEIIAAAKRAFDS